MPQIDPGTLIGRVSLTVSDLDRSLRFYQDVLGFQLSRRDAGWALLGVGSTDLLVLVEIPSARHMRGTTGLYHFAILTSSRVALARSLRRLGEMRHPVQGFADHGVSEAIYLSDPDGNGIEIYRDRPRDEWPFRNDELQMMSDPLDLDSILAEIPDGDLTWPGLDPASFMGHIHLHVANIPEAEAFYGILGFDLMQRYASSASFMSAGGYHHHLGLNTWAGVGAPPPPPDAVGLRWFEVRLPDQAALSDVTGWLTAAGIVVEHRDDGLLVRDPSMNCVLLTGL